MRYYYLIINTLLFLMLAWDKSSAKKRKWRTKESTLLALGILGGAAGGILGMYTFHHKTRKKYFLAVFITSVVLHVVAYYFVFIK